MVDLPRGTVTFLFTDIEGSTELLRRLGGRYAGVLEDHLRLLRAATGDHGGREIDTQGDAFFAAFARASDAVGAAIEAQRALGGHPWPDGASLRVRMGVHTGEPAVGEERFVGLGVHRAARICAAGHGGQVLVSDATHRVLDDDPPEGVSFKDLGRCRLKDFAQPQHIFQLLAPGLRRDFPHVRTAAPARRRQVGVAAAALVALAAVALAIVAIVGGGSESAKVVVKADAVGVIDPASNRLEKQIEVGASPANVLSTRGAVWVSNADGQSVSRIDPATDAVSQTITVGHGPAGLAYADGAVWVANTLDGTVWRIDPATNSVVGQTPVGNDPTAVAAAGGAVWVANSGEQTLSRIDPVSGHETARRNVHATPTGLIAADGALWMSSQQSGSVSRLDPRTGHVESTVPFGGSPSSLAVAGGSLWAANPLDGTVTRIDPERGAVTATITVGSYPDAIVAGPGAVWVSDRHSGTVDRIDPRTNRVVHRIGVGNRPTGIALVNGALWVGVRASGAAHRGGTLTVAAGHGLIFIDPAVAYEPLSFAMLGMTNDGLLAYQHVSGAAGTRLVPDLALTLPHPTDGGRAYRFVLRPGIRYSTGVPVRVDDVRASFERVFKMAPDGVSYLFTGLVGAAACARAPRTCDLSKGITIDRRASAVTFHLAASDPDFPNKVASGYGDILPAGTPARAARAPLPATGPYEIAQFRSGHVLRLVRNPRFREWSQAAQPDGYPDAIVFRSDLTLEAATAAVERGAADDFGGRDSIPPTRLRELITRYPGRTHIEPTTGLEFLFMNTRVPPFDDVRVRQALNYALDRRALVRTLGGSATGAPTCQVLAPNFPGYKRYCPYQPPQLRIARRLVDESGTRGSSVTVGVPSADHLPVARFAASVLQRLGYHASVKTLKHFFPMINDSRSRAQIGAVFVGPDYPAASNLFTTLLSCKAYVPRSPTNINWAEFCDPRIDALMRRASAAELTDPELANRRWALVDRRVVDAAPWVPVYNPASVEIVSKRVGNYQFNPEYGSLLDQLWVH